MKVRYEHTVKREEQKAQGVFDGRFKQRVIVNKKKKLIKKLSIMSNVRIQITRILQEKFYIYFYLSV